MKIKLLIGSGINYYFCDTISLRRSTNSSEPLELDLDSLTNNEVIGLTRAIKTGVVIIKEGEKELAEKATALVSKTRLGRSLNIKEAPVQEVIKVEEEVAPEVITETAIEATESPVEEETKEEVVIDAIAEEVPVQAKQETPKATTSKRAKGKTK